MISTDALVKQLGYQDSPAFLVGNELESLPAYAHVFRRAASKCGLAGVYTLRKNWESGASNVIPVVYVCEAKDSDTADKLHRLVWNQNVVPFVLVRTPSQVRLYSGFAYEQSTGTTSRRSNTQVLREAVHVTELASRILPSFHRDRIDDGSLWRREARYVTPDVRVDRKLLSNLQRLGNVLRDQQGLSARATHAPDQAAELVVAAQHAASACETGEAVRQNRWKRRVKSLCPTAPGGCEPSANCSLATHRPSSRCPSSTSTPSSCRSTTTAGLRWRR